MCSLPTKSYKELAKKQKPLAHLEKTHSLHKKRERVDMLLCKCSMEEADTLRILQSSASVSMYVM